MTALRPRPRDPRHDLLVRAVLSPDAAAEAAYRRWRRGVDVFTLDHASLTIIASLARRLDGLDDDPIAQQITKVARMTWLRGNMLLSRVTVGLEALAASGIPRMLAKGAAVLHHGGLDITRRPMLDVDVCVPIASLRDATLRLVAAGFRSPLESLTANRPDAVTSAVHGVGFYDDKHASIDLHWHLLPTSLHPDAEGGFWAAAEPSHWRGVPVLVSSREDTLLHVIVHGGQFNPDFALRWTTDATLLCTTGDVDWERFTSRALEHRAARPVADALAYLDEVGAVSVPRDALVRLARDRRSPTAASIEAASHVCRPRVEVVGHAARELSRELAVSVEPGRDPTLRDLASLVREHRRGRHGRPSTSPAPVELGAIVPCRLKADGWGAPQLISGWYYPEPHGTWTRLRHARVVIPLSRAHDGPLLFGAELMGYLGPTARQLDCDVLVDRKRVGTWTFTGVEPRPELRCADIPPRPGRDVVDLLLRVRHPRTSDETGGPSEPRALGVSMSWFQVSAAGAPAPVR